MLFSVLLLGVDQRGDVRAGVRGMCVAVQGGEEETAVIRTDR